MACRRIPLVLTFPHDGNFGAMKSRPICPDHCRPWFVWGNIGAIHLRWCRHGVAERDIKKKLVETGGKAGGWRWDVMGNQDHQGLEADAMRCDAMSSQCVVPPSLLRMGRWHGLGQVSSAQLMQYSRFDLALLESGG